MKKTFVLFADPADEEDVRPLFCFDCIHDLDPTVIVRLACVAATPDDECDRCGELASEVG